MTKIKDKIIFLNIIIPKNNFNFTHDLRYAVSGCLKNNQNAWAITPTLRVKTAFCVLAKPAPHRHYCLFRYKPKPVGEP